MKLLKLAFLAVMVGMLATAGAGCQKKKIGDKNPVGPGVQVPENTTGEGTSTDKPLPPGARHELKPVDTSIWDPKAEGSTVYFEFDKCEVRANETAKVEAAAKLLKKNSAYEVRVEGNCDERGSAEYNRGLGQRRAETVRDALVKLGVAETRIETLSNGLEKPVVQDAKTETEHAKNRNGQFIIGKRE
jgi:peptidoglycan-associated lipoprotein